MDETPNAGNLRCSARLARHVHVPVAWAIQNETKSSNGTMAQAATLDLT
jgi:hypothetical protein